MASKSNEDFFLSGPLHLTDVDWRSEHHRRSVAACLVQGVYVLEKDRQKKRQGPHALASPWWESFHFQPIEQLEDPKDLSIFGIVYEFRPPPSGHMALTQSTPKYVIAFRGTIPKRKSVIQDLKLDLDIARNMLHHTHRFELAMEAVQNVVEAFEGWKIWIAGHSLGSAMGMLAGKNMARKNIFLEAFFFNPPFPSAPIKRIKYKKLKHVIRIGSSFLTAGFSVAMKRHNERSQLDDQFAALSPWVPSLYVHPCDHIRSEYIGYFERRKIMEKMGAGGIERLATQNSVANLLLNAMGKDSDPIHLLPSASLITNLNPAACFIKAHGLHHWWGADLHLDYKEYKY